MDFEQLIKHFFDYRNISCDGEDISSVKLQKSDFFIPIVLLLVKQAVNNTRLEDAIVSFTLRKQEQSLCYLAIENLEFSSLSNVVNIIEELGDCEKVPGIDVNDKQQVEIFDLIMKCRKTLKSVDEGTSLESTELFRMIFGDTLSIGLSDDFVQTQVDVLRNSKAEQIKTATLVTHNEPAVMPVFKLDKQYKQLANHQKQLFEELAIIACGSFQLTNPDQNIGAHNKNKLPIIDCEMLLAAILSVPEVLSLIANQFNCQGYQLSLPETVYKLRSYLAQSAETRSFAGAKDISTTWYVDAKTNAPLITLSKPLQGCFNRAFKDQELDLNEFVLQLLALDSDVIAKLIALNKSNNHYVKTTMASEQLATYLSDKVIGQPAAIDSMRQGYLSSEARANEGPRLIYTFAGPSGVGKTYLASMFTQALEQYEKTGYVFNTFNMEQYSDAKDASKLFGSGKQYSDASLGVLTASVRAQPRQVLLFDEIEKAHSGVIQSLLSVLDKGKVQDQTSQEEVDFTQCIVIFTTNLGQELFGQNPQNHLLNVFDVLRNSKNPASGTQLSREFINRLSKGFPVLFSDLKSNHFIRLVERELHDDQHQKIDIKFSWPQDFAGFLLKTLAPEISVRRLNAALPKLKAQILGKAAKQFNQEHTNIEFTISVDQSTLPTAKKCQILLLDDDQRVRDNIETLLAKDSLSLCHSRNELQMMLEQHRPQVLLIDIETIERSDESLANILSEIQAINSNLTLFTYRVNSTAEHAESSISESHDIREHFTIDTNNIETDLGAMIARVQYYQQMEQALQTMNSRHESLSYSCEVKATGNQFDVCFGDLKKTRLIHCEDLAKNNLFSHSLPSNKLADVIGLDRAKQRLVDVIGWLKQPDKLANFGVRLPSGFLFAGPPGTGKTMLAKAVAGECGLPFFSVSAAELSEPHAGGTTENIKKLFATARKYAPAIIFIDEIDAVATQRTNASDGSSRDKNLTVNALLTEMDGFNSQKEPVFVMAATNHPQLLDKAITRPGRFDETIFCDLPNKAARQIFFERFAQKHHLNWLSTELSELVSSAQGMSAAEIEQVLREAIYQAVGDSEALSTEHIKQSMIRIVYGAPAEHIKLSQEEKRRTAYHEAGHLLTYRLLLPNQRIDFATIEPRNQSLGFVSTRASDEYESYSKRTVMNKLQVLLAGRVAEKLATGCIDEISTGASNDIERATQLAMHAIYEGGIEPSIGPINVAMLTRFEESELLSNAQQAVKQWIEQAEQQVEKLLNEHSQQLTLVAEALLDKESLLGNEIDRLFEH